MVTKVLGTPTHLLDVAHPDDGQPLLEVGYTTGAPYPTIIVQNVRTESFHQYEAAAGLRQAIAMLLAGAIVLADRPVEINLSVQALVDSIADDEDRKALSRIASAVSLACISKRSDPHAATAAEQRS